MLQEKITLNKKLLIKLSFIAAFFISLSSLSAEEIDLNHYQFKSYFSPQDELDQVFIKAAQEAQNSILLSIYSFSNKELREILTEKAKKKIQVQILLDNAHKKLNSHFLKTLVETMQDPELIDSEGKPLLEIRYLTKDNHHKYMIVDEKTLLSSSGNISNKNNIGKKYDENLFSCFSCPQAGAYLQEFKRLFQFSTNIFNDPVAPIEVSPTETYNTNSKDTAYFTSSNFKPRYYTRGKHYRSKDHLDENGNGKIEKKIAQEILKATNKIRIATTRFRSKVIFDALKKAADKGIEIEVFLDSQEYLRPSKRKSQEKKVKKCLSQLNEETPVNICYDKSYWFSPEINQLGNNVQLRYKFYRFKWNFIGSEQMHHKYLIVDESTLITGSYNYSKNAETEYFENISILKSTKLIQEYIKNFDEDLLNYGKGNLEEAKAYISTKQYDNEGRPFIPLTLDKAYSLSTAEIDSLIETLNESCPGWLSRNNKTKCRERARKK